MLIRQGEKKENFRFIENDVRNFEILKVLRLRQQRSGDRSPVADDKGTMIFLFSDGQDAVLLTELFRRFYGQRFRYRSLWRFIRKGVNATDKDGGLLQFFIADPYNKYMEYRMDIEKAKIKCVSLNLLFLRYKTKNALRSLPVLHMNFVKSGNLSEFSSKYGNRKMQFNIEYGDMEIRFYSTEVKSIEDMKMQ